MFNHRIRSPRTTTARERSTLTRAHRYRLESLEPRQLLAVDLSASLLNVLPSVTRGARQYADLVISNIGDTDAVGRARITVYMIPKDAEFDPDTAIRLSTIRPRVQIPAGDSVTMNIRPQISRGQTTANFQLVAAVATNNKFDEPDLDNNVAISQPFTVNPSGSDISSSITNISPAAVTGSRQTATLTLTNNGTANAVGTIRIPFFAVPSGSTFDPETNRALTTVRRRVNLAPGATLTIPVSVPLSRITTSGNFQLVASTDATNVLNEADTTNNVAQSTVFTVLPRNGLTVNDNNQLTTANGTVITDANGSPLTAVNGVSNGVVLQGTNGNFLTTAAGNTVSSSVNRTVVTDSNGTVLTNAVGNPFFVTTRNVAGTPVTTVSTAVTPTNISNATTADTVNTINSLNNLGLTTPTSTVSPATVLPTNFTALTPNSLNLTPTPATSTSLVTPTGLNLVPIPNTTTGLTIGNVGLTSLFPTNLNTFPILSNTAIPTSLTATSL